MGHHVRAVNGAGVGGAQMILFAPLPVGSSTVKLQGFCRAGSDPRKDGEAVGW